MTTELVLVRHGETVGESSIRLWGSTDVALSDLGRAQIREARGALGREPFDTVFTSPLVRARESAAILVADAATPTIVVEDLREIDFGEWEGLTVEEILARDPRMHAAWQSGDLDFRFPKGDSRRAFRDRVHAAGKRLFDAASGRILLVAHTGVIRTLMGFLLDLEAQAARALVIGLGSVHRLRHDVGSGWRVVSP